MFLSHDRSAGGRGVAAGARTVELAGNQLPVPSQDGVWPGDMCYIFKSLPAQTMGNFRERSSLRIRKQEPSLDLRPENPVFSGQILVTQQQLLVDCVP